MRTQHFRGPAALPSTRNRGASIHVLVLYFNCMVLCICTVTSMRVCEKQTRAAAPSFSSIRFPMKTAVLNQSKGFFVPHRTRMVLSIVFVSSSPRQ